MEEKVMSVVVWTCNHTCVHRLTLTKVEVYHRSRQSEPIAAWCARECCVGRMYDAFACDSTSSLPRQTCGASRRSRPSLLSRQAFKTTCEIMRNRCSSFSTFHVCASQDLRDTPRRSSKSSFSCLPLLAAHELVCLYYTTHIKLYLPFIWCTLFLLMLLPLVVFAYCLIHPHYHLSLPFALQKFKEKPNFQKYLCLDYLSPLPNYV